MTEKYYPLEKNEGVPGQPMAVQPAPPYPPQYPVGTQPGYSQPPGYGVPPNPQGTYMQPGPPVTAQPPGTTVITMSPAAPQRRPNHGLAVCSLIFAIVTLIITCGGSLFCAVPAIIFSSLALAQDHKVEQAKSLSIASLLFTGLFYICALIAIIVCVVAFAGSAAVVVSHQDTIHSWSEQDDFHLFSSIFT